jgi:hypothetical protein
MFNQVHHAGIDLQQFVFCIYEPIYIFCLNGFWDFDFQRHTVVSCLIKYIMLALPFSSLHFEFMNLYKFITRLASGFFIVRDMLTYY